MTETPEPTTRRTTATTTEPQKPNRLYQAAAWVAIVAGIVFIAAVVFFSGFVLGRHAGPHYFHHHHRHHQAMVHPGHPYRGPGSVAPGGPTRGPGGPVSVTPGPGQPPASIAPSTAPSTP
ncbi:MAG TPA: hypothetical protein VEF72_05585 [Mycobacterium sp.]|nr:hypothetical protein [Mycobacterium sp.]